MTDLINSKLLHTVWVIYLPQASAPLYKESLTQCRILNHLYQCGVNVTLFNNNTRPCDYSQSNTSLFILDYVG